MKTLTALFRPQVLIAGLLLAIISVFVFNINANQSALASNCPGHDDDTNAIIRCGFPDKAGFKADYNANVSGDLPAVYKKFGFNASDMDAIMGNRGHWGWAYVDGRIVLDDGRVVATNAWSIGHENFGDPARKPYTIEGSSQKYYWSYAKDAFADGVTKLRVLVLMDKDDKYMQFASMAACGNPTTGDKPKFECKMLTAKQLGDNEFQFTTTVDLKNATVKNLHYDFGDGSSQDTTNLAVKHTYKTAKKYHVTVTVTYTVNGVTQTEKLQAHCQTDVEVKEKKNPNFSCSLLQGVTIGELKYQFKGKASYKDTEIVSASFDYGDGSTGAGAISNKTATSADIMGEHQYAAFTGKKTISLSVEFKTGNDKHNAKCQTEISREILSACVPKEGEDKDCHELPKTGPAEIFGSAVGLSSIAGAGAYWRASRKSLRDLIKR